MNTDDPKHRLVRAERRVLGIQAKLHRWARQEPHRRFDDLFNLVADPAFLLVAWLRVRGNKGARTAGVDINTAWMWGALLAATMAGWLHQLTATEPPDGTLTGHGERGGRAMIATLRHRLIRVPARVVHHAGQLILRPPPGHDILLAEVLARLRALPTSS